MFREPISASGLKVRHQGPGPDGRASGPFAEQVVEHRLQDRRADLLEGRHDQVADGVRVFVLLTSPAERRAPFVGLDV